MSTIAEPIFAHYHGHLIGLPAGRYWVGDFVPLGFNTETVHATVDDHYRDGIYIKNGVVAGAFCLSLWPEATYAMTVFNDDSAAPVTIRTTAQGLTIYPVEDDAQAERLREFTEQGVVMEFPSGIEVARIGREDGDIALDPLFGQSPQFGETASIILTPLQ
ncbi:hypothetical protein [Sphingomonas sp. 3-13AW]|uniref:hypothetical protein n=1 Tax=Sphingomonas sp. 3-13AW TaxID=3050450 RepID=UPI003BB69B7C